MNRPIALVCYICGREFGTKSLGIHIKACEKKWENEQNLKPPKQRRPCPRPPPGFQQLITKDKITQKDINNYNTQSYDTFVEEGLVECEYCGRRFNDKSLIPHQKACKKDPMIKKQFVNKGALGKHSIPEQPLPVSAYLYKKTEQYGQYNNKTEESGQGNPNLVPCRRCGRTFLPDRVGKHERVCKGEKVTLTKKKQEPVGKKGQLGGGKMKPKFQIGKKAKWKVQHQQFQAAIKAMRQMKAYQEKGGNIRDLPPPPPSNYDHYIQCRHCGRKYAPDVAERHIPKCANIINKPGGIQPSRIQEKYVAGTGNSYNKGITGNTSNKKGASNYNGSNKVSNSITIPFKPLLATPQKQPNTKMQASQPLQSSAIGSSVGKYSYRINKSDADFGMASKDTGFDKYEAGSYGQQSKGKLGLGGKSSNNGGFGKQQPMSIKPNLNVKNTNIKRW